MGSKKKNKKIIFFVILAEKFGLFSGVLKLGGIINAEVDLVVLLLDVSKG